MENQPIHILLKCYNLPGYNTCLLVQLHATANWISIKCSSKCKIDDDKFSKWANQEIIIINKLLIKNSSKHKKIMQSKDI